MKGTAPSTLGEMKDFVCAFAQSTPTSLPKEEIKYWLSRKGELASLILRTLNEALPKFWDWQMFFQKYFNMKLDLSNLKTPPEQESFSRLIIVPKGITPNRIYEVCAKNFSCWKWTNDLDEAIDHNDRKSTETYASWVRDRQEADEENKNISADKATGQEVKGQTLNERLMQELKCWDETKEHLDVKNVTICSGSRYSDGGVPIVDWRSGELDVNWCGPQDASSDWRVRTVVSF